MDDSDGLTGDEPHVRFLAGDINQMPVSVHEIMAQRLRNTIRRLNSKKRREADSESELSSATSDSSPEITDDEDFHETPLRRFCPHRRLMHTRPRPPMVMSINDTQVQSPAYLPSGRISDAEESLWRLCVFFIVLFLSVFISVSFYEIFLRNE